ncbi:DUF3450 family protein [Salinisphaera sp. P385]|uniref:DUF3450 family protein n=1 Tax=Spectribacter acetivorans TaxID=3075603 RepID=A0ABU3BDK1_9GAMM|nr:DUF3450 family protein [Salinisphaera sp. P385]MDT0619423.1 DUF3450 family protein [Salinisphaera sp. P385]
MIRLVPVLLAALFAGTVSAAPSLESLLREVEEAQQASNRINREREQRFLENKQEQQRLLAEARAELAPIESRTSELRGRYDSLQQEITALQTELEDKAGDLNQMVAVVRQAAGDLQAVASDSLITAQYPERESQLSALAASDSVPSAEELQQLWFLLQQEMTASGQVTTFDAPVVAPDGSTAEEAVTRVGSFVAVAGGDYLQYLPGTGLKRLARQPGGGARSMAADLESADSGLVPMAIDPTRGNILSLLGQRPDLLERVHQGGGVGYVIIGLGVFGVLLAIWQFLRLLATGRRVRGQLKNLGEPSSNNPLGRILQAARDADADDPEGLELSLDEAVIREAPRLQRTQPLIKLLAAVAPLMGLLGTVVGMIATFQAITLFGTGDPKLMAGGISQALVTTVLGLVVAIPLLFAHSLLASRSRGLIQILEEQSAGLLARYLESRTSGSSRA